MQRSQQASAPAAAHKATEDEDICQQPPPGIQNPRQDPRHLRVVLRAANVNAGDERGVGRHAEGKDSDLEPRPAHRPRVRSRLQHHLSMVCALARRCGLDAQRLYSVNTPTPRWPLSVCEPDLTPFSTPVTASLPVYPPPFVTHALLFNRGDRPAAAKAPQASKARGRNDLLLHLASPSCRQHERRRRRRGRWMRGDVSASLGPPGREGIQTGTP